MTMKPVVVLSVVRGFVQSIVGTRRRVEIHIGIDFQEEKSGQQKNSSKGKKEAYMDWTRE